MFTLYIVGNLDYDVHVRDLVGCLMGLSGTNGFNLKTAQLVTSFANPYVV